jgi:protein subunit release factor A
MNYSPEFKKNFATAYLAEEYERLEKEAKESLESAGTDAELLHMAEEDAVRLRSRQEQILVEIEQIIAKDREKEDTAEPVSVILELRAGAGGDEASIFAHELKEMYQKYADSRGWKTRTIDDLSRWRVPERMTRFAMRRGCTESSGSRSPRSQGASTPRLPQSRYCLFAPNRSLR